MICIIRCTMTFYTLTEHECIWNALQRVYRYCERNTHELCHRIIHVIYHACQPQRTVTGWLSRSRQALTKLEHG
jgi:hypothetical protein